MKTNQPTTSKDPFQSSKELFYKTPAKTRMTSPTANIPDLSNLFNQKLAYFSNSIKNFLISATKIQKLLIQRSEDPEALFAVKLFDEDKRQIESFLKKMDAVDQFSI